jgi:hypothetical protein
MRQLFEDRDLGSLDVHLSHHRLEEQAELVTRGELDVAAFVMEGDAALLGEIVRIPPVRAALRDEGLRAENSAYGQS